MKRKVKSDKKKKSLAKKALVGAAGGLAASWLMNVFQNRVLGRNEKPSPFDDESATAKVAEKAAALAGRHLDEMQLEKAEPAVHYLFGATLGAIYGLLEGRIPFHGILSGVAYGTAVWLLADEIAVPGLNLARGPAEYPVSSHLRSLGAHLVYGAGVNAFSRAYEGIRG